MVIRTLPVVRTTGWACDLGSRNVSELVVLFRLAPQRPFQGPRPWRTPEALTDPILSGMSRPRSAARRLAACRCSRPPRRAGGAANAASTPRPPVEAGGGSGGEKVALYFLTSFANQLLQHGIARCHEALHGEDMPEFAEDIHRFGAYSGGLLRFGR